MQCDVICMFNPFWNDLIWFEYCNSIIIQNCCFFEIYLNASIRNCFVLLIIELFHKIFKPKECIFFRLGNCIVKVCLILCFIKLFLCSLLLIVKVVSVATVRRWITI